MLKVLIIENESIIALEVCNYLKSLECEVIDIVQNGLDALKIIESKEIDLVVMDIFLEGELDGIDTAREIKNKNIMIIFLTANNTKYNINKTIEINPLAYLTKPFNRKELYTDINMIKYKLTKKTKP